MFPLIQPEELQSKHKPMLEISSGEFFSIRNFIERLFVVYNASCKDEYLG
ncbi:hypothetical protein M145_2427 [Bacteroides fragilis str. 34-F-2 |nr:hypothetical protein M145_2427 [Bacteroides fragilis str. 34-F-2 \